MRNRQPKRTCPLDKLLVPQMIYAISPMQFGIFDELNKFLATTSRLVTSNFLSSGGDM